MKIVVRLDVSSAIGTGHWRRMNSLLAKMPDAFPIFVIRTDDPQNQLFRDYVVRRLDPDEDEYAVLAGIIRDENAGLILLDLLNYPPDYVAEVKRLTGCRVVSFHEYGYAGELADLAVNYNPFNGWESAGSPNFLAGPEYCILDDTIRKLRREKDTDSILVFFGGSDPSDFATVFLATVVPALPKLSFILHQGPFCHANRVSLKRNSGNVRQTHPVESFHQLMSCCRLLVTTAGNTMYEACYLGLVPLVIAHNVHQAEFAYNTARAGACLYFGTHPKIDWHALTSTLDRQYANPPATSQSWIDGLGSERLVKRIRNLIL